MPKGTLTLPLGEQNIVIELPELATQAGGEALVRLGDTVVLVTAVMNSTPRESVDYFPLMVDFEEKYYAAGIMRGSRFIKREARPSDAAILSARLIDRTIRPRFPKGMRNDVQVIATVLSYDGENDPDALTILGASTALMVSDIPWDGPVAGTRVAGIDGKLVLYPTESQRKEAAYEFIVSSIQDHVNMLEGGAAELPEDEAIAAIAKAHETMQDYIERIAAFAKKHGKEKRPVVRIDPSEESRKAVKSYASTRLEELLFSPDIPKKERMDRVNELKRETIDHFTKGETISERDTDTIFEDEINQFVHERAIAQKERSDGRAPDDVRELDVLVSYLPRTHGSSIFTRGDTRALATVTLASPGGAQLMESMEGEWKKHFMLHYNFPPFSVGDTRPMRGPGRRDIGHGALAERAIEAVMPDRETFPYTIRVVSEILSSNGSSSMASACAASLALMDAGVPITRHVAGIAMGIMVEEQPKNPKKPRYCILTDIQGPEDHHGDMDLKIAGTRQGITGMQMDVKIAGVTIPMLEEAFTKAKTAREHILDAMEKVLAAPRDSVGTYAPKIIALTIKPEKIRDIIGPGGRVINGIIDRTGAQIDVEQDGSVFVTAVDEKAVQQAADEIRDITRETEVGEEFEGEVTRIFPFGAMVGLFAKQEGLIHISELSSLGVRHPDDAFTVGMKVSVIVKEIDAQGRVNLSLKDPASITIKPSTGARAGDRRDDRRGAAAHGRGSEQRPRRRNDHRY